MAFVPVSFDGMFNSYVAKRKIKNINKKSYDNVSTSKIHRHFKRREPILAKNNT